MSACSELAPAKLEPAAPVDRSSAWSVAARGGVLSVLDQALVSGTSFLSVVLVGRACGEVELGYYSLGATVLVLLASLQDSLITAPYTVFRERMRGRRREEYAGRVLVQQIAMALLAAGALTFAAFLFHGVHGEMAWVLAAIVPFALIREFSRRLCFVHARIGGALVLDLSVAVLQLSTLAWLSATERLTASFAFVAVGGACGAAAVASLLLTRSDFALSRRRPERDVGRHWAFGRWIAAGQMVGVVHGYAVHWLLMLLIGPSATGAFAACLAVALLANPFYLGVSNLLGPWTARVRAADGSHALRRLVLRAAAFLVAVMSVFCLVVALIGDRVMGLLYGNAFSGHGLTLAALAGSIAVTSAGMAADHGLRALGRPRVAFTGSLIGLVVTVVSGILLAPHWGIAGAACGYLMGTTASAAVRMSAFLKLTATTECGE